MILDNVWKEGHSERSHANRNLNDQEKLTILRQGKGMPCISRDYRMDNSPIFVFQNGDFMAKN